MSNYELVTTFKHYNDEGVKISSGHITYKGDIIQASREIQSALLGTDEVYVGRRDSSFLTVAEL